MSYYAGQTLKERLTSRGAMPIEDALDIAQPNPCRQWNHPARQRKDENRL